MNAICVTVYGWPLVACTQKHSENINGDCLVSMDTKLVKYSIVKMTVNISILFMFY